MQKDQRYTRVNGHYATGEPSVTTILKVIDKPALTNWLMKQVFDATVDGAKTFSEAQKRAKKVSSKACDIGTLVHKYVEEFDLASKSGTQVLPDGHEDYAKAFIQWWIDVGPEIIDQEKTVASREHGFKGTVDMIARIDGKKCIVDIKTGKGIYESVELQTSAYRLAYQEQEGKEIDEVWCLLLEKGGDGLPTGKYRFEKQKYVPEVFLSALRIYNWRKQWNQTS